MERILSKHSRLYYTRSSGPTEIEIRFNQSPSALFLDTMSAANFGATFPASLAKAPVLIVEIATKDNSRLLLSPFSLTSSDAFAIMQNIKRQNVIGLNLLQLIEGKTADNGKKYNSRYTEYYLLKEIFSMPCGARNAEGMKLILSDTMAYQKYYTRGTFNLEKELNYILKVIFTSANTTEPVENLVQMCQLEKKNSGEVILNLPQVVLDIFARLDIHISEPVTGASLPPKQASNQTPGYKESALVKNESILAFPKAPTFFASPEPTIAKFNEIKNLFEELTEQTCQVKESILNGLDIQFNSKIENVSSLEKQFRQQGLFGVYILSSVIRIPADFIEPTIKTLENLLAAKKQLNPS